MLEAKLVGRMKEINEQKLSENDLVFEELNWIKYQITFAETQKKFISSILTNFTVIEFANVGSRWEDEMLLASLENKDINDLKMMEALIEKNNFKRIIAFLDQKLLYLKLITKTKIVQFRILVLKKVGLYEAVRSIYYKFQKLRNDSKKIIP